LAATVASENGAVSLEEKDAGAIGIHVDALGGQPLRHHFVR